MPVNKLNSVQKDRYCKGDSMKGLLHLKWYEGGGAIWEFFKFQGEGVMEKTLNVMKLGGWGVVASGNKLDAGG